MPPPVPETKQSAEVVAYLAEWCAWMESPDRTLAGYTLDDQRMSSGARHRVHVTRDVDMMDRVVDGCLKMFDSCQVYLLIVGTEYGTRTGDISLTHAEYRRAKDRGASRTGLHKGRNSRADGVRGTKG